MNNNDIVTLDFSSRDTITVNANELKELTIAFNSLKTKHSKKNELVHEVKKLTSKVDELLASKLSLEKENEMLKDKLALGTALRATLRDELITTKLQAPLHVDIVV